MNWLLLIVVALIGTSTFPFSNAKSRQKRWWFWYNGYADTILGFIYTVKFQTFLPGLGPLARSLQDVQENGDENELSIQPQYQEETERALNIFYHLGIKTPGCQERLICFLSSDPDMFSPISELILREIGEEYGPIEKSDKSLTWKYNKALRTGIVSSLKQCEQVYKECPMTPREILNISALKAWQFVASKIGMTLL